jgi:hypothetical protein
VLLALIPLVCLYVDAVCFHCEIRIITIARFMRSTESADLMDNRIYERYCERHRTHFALISVALLGASVILSGLVFGVGVSHTIRTLLGVCAASQPGRTIDCEAIQGALVVTGAAGIIGSLVFYSFSQNRSKWLDQAAPDARPPRVWRFFFGSGIQ